MPSEPTTSALSAADGMPIERQWFLLRHEDTELTPSAARIRTAIIGLGGAFLPQAGSAGVAPV